MKLEVVERWVRWILFVAGLIAFAFVIASVDLSRSAHLITAAGPLLAVALVPYLVQLGLDSLAWRMLLGMLGRRVAWRRLLAVRLSTEAVLMSMPAGSVIGETLKPYLLHRTDQVPAADTIASIGAKKSLLVFAQALYLAIALIVGWSLFDDSSTELIGRGGLPYVVAGAIAVLIALGGALAAAFLGGAVGERLHQLLRLVPIDRFRNWIEARREPFTATDRSFQAIGRGARAPQLGAFALLTLAWLTEAAETWILLLLLGIDLGPDQALAMEASVIFLRYLAFFVPAGLGVQDAGYLAFLHAFGVAGASGAGGAFVIVKRAKEAVWVAIGYLTLFVLETGAARRPPAAEGALLLTTENV